jgi:hypothetical protein
MKIRIVGSKGEIENLNPNEEMIHLRFRPSNVDLLNLTKRCPGLRAVQMPSTYCKTLSNAITDFMNMKGIELIAGDPLGHKKCLDEYLFVDDATEKEILAPAKKRHSCGRDGK